MRVTITDLVDVPGATRPLAVDAPLEAFGDDAWGPADGVVEPPVVLDLDVDAVVDGILVRGTVLFHLRTACSRCLTPHATDRVVEVVELFTDPARAEPDDEPDPGYEMLDNRTAIDLSTLVRDALLIDLPLRVLCSPDCAGLCATCGADLNVAPCGHGAAGDLDPRWAALTELRLPPE